MDSKAKLVLVIGGSRSGKSRFAEAYCLKLQTQSGLPVTYLATCPRLDAELEARISAHVARRPADWGCVEETTHVAERIRELGGAAGILLLDCLSLLLNNWIWEAETRTNGALSDQTVTERTEDLIRACKQHPHPVVIVTSEVGAGIVPESPALRAYRDQLGFMNQQVARAADAVYAVIAGIPVNLKEIQVQI